MLLPWSPGVRIFNVETGLGETTDARHALG